MSGGIAYIFDEDGDFRHHCNQETVSLETPDAADLQEIEALVRRHATCTQSERALQILAVWNTSSSKFVKVMPKDYQRMLEAIQHAERDGLTGDDAVMAAFEANKNDASRVSGN
jgi:glutamate synthase (ferredoxin)